VTARGRKKRRGKTISFNLLIPNILTLLALASGLTAMRFAFQERWEWAVFAIIAAAILDALDGRMARLLKGTSEFGAELDSLSDIVSFGVAPAMILYLWAMQDAGRGAWVLVMIFTMCCGLRLARFNVTHTDDKAPKWKAQFFTGVPAPAGAGLALLPMILSFQLGDTFFRSPWLVGVVLLGVGALLVSSLPSYSFKRLDIPRHRILVIMLAIALTVALFASVPWLSITIILGLYIVSIGFSWRAYKRLKAGRNPDKPPQA
jgi:CDP-diacylglycerol--serine O-phosphatidyltransferase